MLDLRRGSGELASAAAQLGLAEDRRERRGRQLLCAACGHRITTEATRIEMDGRHQHHCVNPHGYAFDIGCFAAAPGCRVCGAPTLEFTWFAGFAWSYALCGGCNELLGWRYDGSDGSSFYGLILNRIVADKDQ